ncbi:MAG: ATP-binding protein [Candidatus Hydrogenedentes bacterium]|nr:ATP-binding protein [Candidatus Hydrogenedentota bacterium]
MTGQEKIEFPARPEALELVVQWLHDLAVHYRLPDQTVGELDLILEELVMNAANHAVPIPPDTKPIPVRIEARLTDNEITLTVADRSLPFDPLSRPVPELFLDLEDRPVGGLGVHIVKQLSDSFQHTYEDGWNVSHIRKSIPGENRK